MITKYISDAANTCCLPSEYSFLSGFHFHLISHSIFCLQSFGHRSSLSLVSLINKLEEFFSASFVPPLDHRRTVHCVGDNVPDG